jgi:hypothetical protein
LNVLRDGVAVTRSGQKRPEDQKVERASQEIDTRGSGRHRVGSLHIIV